MSHHADQPLCPYCGEDRPSMVDTDTRLTTVHCAACGKSWPVTGGAGNVGGPRTRDATRPSPAGFWDGQVYHVGDQSDY